uniref:FHA domain-containing protein n=1 Tax=Oryctolagus cuniculus TaxID=9986 RepID=G1SH01_RABIT
MEDTQAIILETEDEEDTEQSNHIAGGGLEPVGRLHVFSSTHGPEKDFPLYLGKNVVGRMPDCSVALQFPSISKQHAVIEILAQGKAPLLHDCGSLNVPSPGYPHTLCSPGPSNYRGDPQGTGRSSTSEASVGGFRGRIRFKEVHDARLKDRIPLFGNSSTRE